jgi:rhamnogalacturonan endolyase
MGGAVTRRSVLGALGAVTAGAALGPAAAAAGAPSGGCRLEDGGDRVVLGNGLVAVTVVKATGQVPVLVLEGSRLGNQGVNLVSGTNGQGYSTFDYYVGTTRYSKGLSGASYRVVADTPERVEIALAVADPAVLPFAVELRFAVLAGRPGLYGAMAIGYPEGMPDGLTIQQLRYAVAAGDLSFSWFVVDGARGIRQRPTIAEEAAWTTLQDTTYALPDGRIWSKYQNISDLEGDNHAFLVSNGRLGLAMVQGGKEAFDGGPTKQELTAHDYYNGEILLWHPFTSHYGSPDLEPPKGWQKFYGPFYLHVTEAVGADPEAAVGRMWADTQRAAARERAAWPYRWVDHPLYAAADRSTVRGRLAVEGGSAAGAWVVLSQPGPDREYQGVTLDGRDWQYHGLDYVYSGRADHRGSFAVPAVRPGTYTLSAFVDGVLGEYTVDGVEVGAGRTVDLGRLAWRPDRHGRTLWQLGTPNRSAAEFAVYGGADGFRRHLTWLEYPYQYPGDVDLTIGVDDPATAWNYFQPCYRTPGTPFQLQWRGTTPDRTLTTWTVRFDAPGYRRGTATLDIALAGAVFATLRVALNGTDLASFDPLPGVVGDNSSYRLACRGMYRRLPPITFPATLLARGPNALTFSPVRPPKAPLTRGNTVDDWMEPIAGLMYDTIRLQVPD